jgi:glycosyltransferase involved in cell wall biosynthesis|tara:strand:- start:1597 stop:2367 length:771 start_codon:yes stop_codon:yes gene_type:complete
MNISVAIPTYRSSSFLEQTLNSLQGSNVIDDIVISDNSQDKIEQESLKKIVLKFKDLNISLNINDKNLGPYKNKYICVQNCKNAFVYQLDSDNRAIPKYINQNFTKDLKKDFMYLPGIIYLFNYKKRQKFPNTFKSKKVKFVKNDVNLNLKDIQSEMVNQNIIYQKNIDWILNLGNHLVNRDFYLSSLEEGLGTKLNITSDAMAQTYFWLKNGGELYVTKSLRHYHGLRDDSIWTLNSKLAQESVDNFKKLINQIP